MKPKLVAVATQNEERDVYIHVRASLVDPLKLNSLSASLYSTPYNFVCSIMLALFTYPPPPPHTHTYTHSHHHHPQLVHLVVLLVDVLERD